ncbi:hypothetical protein THAOC_15965 [Thalassiosira oceanica]|uniref:Uncharacterized protein n=1 Tax=Thalassiosira oceanica TaxID=159749 RepID=K0SB71_THAOC|nr:hypothetical protein THAOC_15965 [Thalassiosira oceanica]|eukprot:EJK63378.1 hypothetical protein THAOC_15965 [Thalassiosira oceanica]
MTRRVRKQAPVCTSPTPISVLSARMRSYTCLALLSVFAEAFTTCNRAVDLVFCDDDNSGTVRLFASKTDDAVEGLSCGPGFNPVQGEDGPCCAYDFDAIQDTTETLFENNSDLRTQLNEKNKTRKKFGLEPISPEEFVVLQAEIHAMEREQRLVQSELKQTILQERQSQAEERKRPGLQSFIDSIFEDTCQSNYDCSQPEVCCDFGFKKVCCSSGNYNRDIENELLAMIRVPQAF